MLLQAHSRWRNIATGTAQKVGFKQGSVLQGSVRGVTVIDRQYQRHDKGSKCAYELLGDVRAEWQHLGLLYHSECLVRISCLYQTHS